MSIDRVARWMREVWLLVALAPHVVFAQIPTIVPCTGATGAKPCTFCHIAELAQNTINAGIYIAVFMSAFLFAYAGWQYVTAAGQPDRASNAKKIFWTVGVGLVVILAAWLIVDVVMKMFTNEGALFGPWNDVC